MSYKRRPSWSSYDSGYSTQTTISIHWSTKSSAYAIKFSDTKNWTQMQILIGYLKNIQYGERDYDPENKVWYLIEKHIVAFKEMVVALNTYFKLDFIEKPTGQTNFSQFVPVDVYLDRFKDLTTFDVRGMEYTKAKMIYRKFSKVYHPDLNPGDDTSKLMSDLNQCWTELERVYFKSKGETCQIV